MKLSVIQDHLARGLAVVGHAVAVRNALPILSNVYLGTEDGGLCILANPIVNIQVLEAIAGELLNL